MHNTTVSQKVLERYYYPFFLLQDGVSLLLTLPPSKQKGKRYHISAQFAQFSQRSSNNVELRKGSFRQKDTIVIVCFIIHLSPHYERTTLCYTVRGSFNLSPKKAITYCSRLPHYYLTVIFYFCKYLPLSLPLFTLVYWRLYTFFK